MAKSTKLKKETEPIAEVKEPILSEPVPPSVTLDEVKELEEKANEPEGKVYVANEDYIKVKEFANTEISELSIEEKVLKFIESRGSGKIELNSFLKSLYGVQKFNEPPKWLKQGTNRQLRAILEKMQQEGKINIDGRRHMRLGQPYYADSKPETQYHNLNTVPIIVNK